MAFDAKALGQAASENANLLKLSGIGVLIAIVLLIVVGIFGGLVNDGTISVPTAVNTTIQGAVTTFGTIMTAGIAVFTTLIGFVIIVAIMKAFGINISLGTGKSRD